MLLLLKLVTVLLVFLGNIWMSQELVLIVTLFIIEVVICILLGMESFPVETLKKLGFNLGDYGLHNLRSGGITSVVHNSSNSVPERLLRLHGRWKTNAAKAMYVKESLEKRLEVPVMRHLGL